MESSAAGRKDNVRQYGAYFSVLLISISISEDLDLVLAGLEGSKNLLLLKVEQGNGLIIPMAGIALLKLWLNALQDSHPTR
jgi:hypothetical protein